MDENQQIQPAQQPGMPQRASAMMQSLAARLRGMEGQQRLWLLGAGGLALLCILGILWFATRTDWKVLYAGLESADAREIASELTAANIPFDVSPDGATLRVPATNLDKARLATTAKGGPRSGRMGFELFDKPNWIGSEFDEKVNYQRALEGELEHTINTLSEVESARVHLVMPHDSLYTSQQRNAKASVVLKLKRRSLSDEQADAIRNLVASAVDDLHPEDVALVDAEGRLQLGRRNASADAAAHEQELAAKLIETLEPVAGVGNVRASVNVDYDSSTADEVDETYDPNNVVTLSMQRSEQTSGAQSGPDGRSRHGEQCSQRAAAPLSPAEPGHAEPEAGERFVWRLETSTPYGAGIGQSAARDGRSADQPSHGGQRQTGELAVAHSGRDAASDRVGTGGDWL